MENKENGKSNTDQNNINKKINKKKIKEEAPDDQDLIDEIIKFDNPNLSFLTNSGMAYKTNKDKIMI